VLSACLSFGHHLGLLIQIANDIEGLWSNDGCDSDLARGQWSLPVAYAFQVLPSEKQARLRLLIGTAAAEAEARRVILDCGALIYLALETEKNKRQAANALGAVGDQIAVEPLIRLLHRVSSGPQER
jgi:geranylgeranyl pyrophosphate synthase